MLTKNMQLILKNIFLPNILFYNVVYVNNNCVIFAQTVKHFSSQVIPW